MTQQMVFWMIDLLIPGGMAALPQLRDCEFHSTQMLHSGDEGTLRRLGLRVTCEAVYPGKDLFF